MAQKSAMNSASPTEEDVKSRQEGEVKTEVEVKLEALDCLVCGARSRDVYDVYAQCTAASGASLHAFIAKFTQLDLAFVEACAKCVCKSCFDLINVLERAELDYLKLKETFESILSKNPLFELAVVPQPIGLSSVKRELAPPGDDSEDEPLARQTRARNSKTLKKKKKLTTGKTKKKRNDKSEWECEECGAAGQEGGEVALAAHKLAVHTLEDTTIKTEDGINTFHSESPFSNSLEVDIMFEDFDDDDSNFIPEEFTNGEGKKKETKGRKKLSTEKKPPKQMLQCDQCDSRYTSQVRLEAHKHKKHDGSKPPYICEVCGAHYKHKRACDIHIALHKGISDWKCEECNKLFPSKNALQRHNNIHTGKLNYQCDLCGKSFIHTSSFKMHKLTHSGVKPHACDVCGLRLMTRSHLKRHKRIHSGEKRHECQVCGKRFSERYNLAAHLKAHEATDGALPPRAAVVRRLFRCHFCVERFERRYMLERHMSAIHGRTLERPPPTPRNTMSKLLKQRAQRPPPTPGNQESSDTKEGSPEARAPLAPSKLLAHLTSSASIITTGSWSGAYAAEFGLRTDFPH